MKKQLLIASDHNGKKLKDIIINKFKNQSIREALRGKTTRPRAE